jgi:Tfp pilus assembly protein PilO
MDALRGFLDRYLPLVGVVLGLYFAYDIYSFLTDPSSEWVARKTQVQAQEESVRQLETQVKQAEAFFKTLEAKKVEIRNLAVQLNEMKVSLSNDLDVPSLLKVIASEAQRVGLRVQAIRPGATQKRELYVESAFELEFRGVFAQVVIFMQRLASAPRILKIENFMVEPTLGGGATTSVGSSNVAQSSNKYVELKGTLQIIAYAYNASKADDIAEKTP